ncbi:hypothetical protein Tco_0799949 [Tanacetum coccineum]|uniref:Uncharacterized protein n=1 Tax=Tanacetum coccineum TaxID=301880 RepID=A0ABQ4ZU14_9ASTR
MMAALEVVNARVSYQVDVRSRESSEFYSQHHDAQKDRVAVRAKIGVLRRERLAYETLEAPITVLETEARRHEWQRQDADDHVVEHIMRTQALEARKMAPKRRTTRLNPGATPTPVTDTHTTTPVTNAQIQAMINEGVTTALAARDATRNGDDSHTL